jgi:hypothetical protein
MRPEQSIKTAHPCIYPSMRRSFVDSFLDKGIEWLRIDYIPWHLNPCVIWEQEAIQYGKIKYGKRRAYEWRWRGHIYHRDVYNHIWQKVGSKMNWVGIYDPESDTIDNTAIEPK